MDIKEARKQIDSIDSVLVTEFEKRLTLIKEIGKYKDEHHLPLIDEEHMHKHIFLIGMPGAGKTTVGKVLAKELGRDFFDLDQTIQDKVGKSVQNIYIYDGKDAFSEYEYTTIKELIHNKPSVIATGGGTVTYDKTVKLMRNNGLVVFVNRDVNHILDDLDLEIRPLVKESIEYIFNVYEERYPLYEEVAHIKIGNEGSITDAVQEIIEALPNTEK